MLAAPWTSCWHWLAVGNGWNPVRDFSLHCFDQKVSERMRWRSFCSSRLQRSSLESLQAVVVSSGPTMLQIGAEVQKKTSVKHVHATNLQEMEKHCNLSMGGTTRAALDNSLMAQDLDSSRSLLTYVRSGERTGKKKPEASRRILPSEGADHSKCAVPNAIKTTTDR